jgi:hypothetical protein
MMSGPIAGAWANFSPQKSTKSWLVTIQPTQLSIGSGNAYASLSARFSVGCCSKIDWAQGISLEDEPGFIQLRTLCPWSWRNHWTSLLTLPLCLAMLGPDQFSNFLGQWDSWKLYCLQGSNQFSVLHGGNHPHVLDDLAGQKWTDLQWKSSNHTRVHKNLS